MIKGSAVQTAKPSVLIDMLMYISLVKVDKCSLEGLDLRLKEILQCTETMAEDQSLTEIV